MIKRQTMNKKIFELIPKYMDNIPGPWKKEEGILYISKKFEIAIHLCACGCGIETVTPLGNNNWSISEDNEKVTLRPSIGNFKWESPYHAHYFITNNKIDWL